MNINKLVIIFLIGLFHPLLYSQNCNCHKGIIFNENESLLIALDDFIKGGVLKDRSNILVDYQKDSIIVFRITESNDPLELLFKKPDCYFDYRNKSIFLYTEKYAIKKDTIWLNNIFQETIKKKYGETSVIVVQWKNDSIVRISNIKEEITGTFDPTPTEYHIKEKVIIKKSNYQKMFYPETSKPKGILLDLTWIRLWLMEHPF